MLIYFLLFTTADIPAFLMKRAGSLEKISGESSKALVLKWVRPDSLNPGDLVLVERQSGDATIREIQK